MGPFEKFFDFDRDGKLNAIEASFLLDEIERIEEEVESSDISSVDYEDEEEDLDDIDLDVLDLDDLDIDEF